MPYNSNDELPEEIRRRYSAKQQRAFRHAYNSCAEDGGSESRCFRVAHSAAQQARELGTEAADLGRRRAEEVARQFTQRQRQRLAREGKALPDGSYPIENEGDLRNAIQAYGRASNPEATKRHIIKRARALGRTDLLPEGWGREESGMSESSRPPETREVSTGVQDVTRAFVTEHGGRLFLTAPGQELLPGLDPEVADWDSDNPNFLYLRGAFVGSEKANRNGAMWTTEDLEMGEPTVRHGPLNWLHEERKVIGAITEASLVHPSGAEVASTAHPFIQATSVLWRFLWPDEAQVVQHASETERLWYSMECISQSVECASFGCGEFPYIDVVRKRASVCEHVREKSGVRRFVSPIFLGGAVIVPPARPGWPEANAQLMRRASSLAEAAFDQAGRPNVSSEQWERLMAQVLAFAGAEKHQRAFTFHSILNAADRLTRDGSSNGRSEGT